MLESRALASLTIFFYLFLCAAPTMPNHAHTYA